MLIEPLIAAFVAAYATVVALGHVLLIAAICKRPPEDDADWRGGPANPVAVVAPALCNAFFSATGKHVRSAAAQEPLSEKTIGKSGRRRLLPTRASLRLTRFR